MSEGNLLGLIMILKIMVSLSFSLKLRVVKVLTVKPWGSLGQKKVKLRSVVQVRHKKKAKV